MAIVINGSGTVTGISVGGLPDGVVDAGTLATNSVDSAELVDGSIDTAHIGTDQITSAILPAGSVLQVVQATSNTQTNPSTSWTAVSGSSVAITPSATSSKILYIFNAPGFVTDTGTHGLKMKLLRGSTEIRRVNRWGYFAGSGHAPANVTYMYLDSPSTTSATTYSINAAEEVSGGWEINSESETAGAVVIAMEIAG